eukprot:88755_1
MAMSQCQKNMIYQHIDQATSINDVAQMLQFIELQTVKDTLKQQIETISSTEISNIFYASLSIESILPFDLIQHITSFNNLSNIKSVSETFNKCYQKNRNIQSKQRAAQCLSQIQINETHNTWIVDQLRTKLNNKELSLKCKGPLNQVEDAIKSADTGDVILIYNGSYVEGKNDDSDDFDIINIDKCLQIIGCGDNVLINWLAHISSNVCFKNIKFKTPNDYDIQTKAGGFLIMENCDIIN